ncbi:MAG TPA: DUF1269 domain-containing protein [Acidimicrobiales bacterium]|nr:DUF1269 domain-containing protein [Acidimicrobiales bacterium]
MATLTVWKFDTAGGADRAETVLEHLSKEQLITVEDAAVVSWPTERKSPKTRQLHSLAGAGALGGAFWGFLFGLLFFVPLFGLAIGAAAGAIGGALTDVGIDDSFIASVKARIQPGTSALFVLSTDAVVDKVLAEFAELKPELIQSNLTSEQESHLREIFHSA